MKRTHDLIVIGAGAAGLTAAGGCAQFGLRVALIEKGAMGGDCLNTGCVPSKAMIAAANRAQAMREAGKYGVGPGEPAIDFAAVHAHVRGVIDAIAEDDSQERFEQEFGVEVIRGAARFVGPMTVEADGRRLTAPRICLALGSRPRIPAIPGLETVRHLTNETLFDLTERPDHLAILGGGPIGIEMAQAFRRLGSRVTVFEQEEPLAREDREAAALVAGRLRAEGVDLRENALVERIAREGERICLETRGGERVAASHLLVAAGRDCDFAEIGLEAAGVRWDATGIAVDARRRTSNRRIFAIGDCRGGPRFTHVSGYEGSLVVLQVALGLPSKADFRALPRVTYTDPELAQVGLTDAEARVRHGERISVTREDFAHNDRARAERETEGFVKIVRKGSKVLGATAVGKGAGELILPWGLAIAGKVSPFAIGGAIVPYPTRSDISKQAGFAIWEPTIFGRWPRRWARFRARYLL